MSASIGLRAVRYRREAGVVQGTRGRSIWQSSIIRAQDSEKTESRLDKTTATEKQERENVLEQIRKSLRQRRSEIEPRIKQRLEELGKRWNEYSGYEEVTEAKAQTLEAEMHLKELRSQQNQWRKDYVDAVNLRSSSQKTLTDLLNRRADWSEADISKYTELLRSEHSQAKSEKEAGEKSELIERKVNEAWDDVVKKTLERYHLEQVWSDRVRAGSTYGGLIVAGLNVMLFTLAFIIVEPYKRKKLAQTFESRLLKGEEQNAAMLASVVGGFEKRLASVQDQGGEVNKAMQILLSRDGLEVQRNSEEPADKEEALVVVPAPITQQSIKDKRRDMALAGGLGFAIGAGILAAMGALRS
jgi:sensitive to high expression protein 9